MSQTIEVKVPDIGDFKDVAVIEVFVKAGDKIEAEQSLITLETDKAAMEVPCPAAGVVKALKVKVGDKVSEGSVILTLERQAPPQQAASKTRCQGASCRSGKHPPDQHRAPSAAVPPTSIQERRYPRRSAGAGRRPRRLYRRVPRCRSGQAGGAGRKISPASAACA